MLTPDDAADLIRRADSIARLGAIATRLGFDQRAGELSSELRAELALPAAVTCARVSRGAGGLRCLLVELSSAEPLRATVTKLASALSRHAPYSLWLVVGRARYGSAIFVAAWSREGSAVKVRSLVCDRNHPLASDVETLCALAAVDRTTDLLAHTRWLEVLGRDALTRRFYLALREAVTGIAEAIPGHVPRSARDEIALINASRLVFLCFLQVRGLLDDDHEFLINAVERVGERLHARVLEPLFFGTLNTRASVRARRAREFGRIPYLNGGLFSRSRVERRFRDARIGDAAIAALFDNVLARYRFTPHEDAATWSEAAVDPEILGRAFEALMDPRSRKSSGTYYTPANVVRRATQAALAQVLGPVQEPVDPALTPALVARLRTLTVLDPACGSGAYLVHMLAVLGALRERHCGESPAVARREVLARSLFGVDIDATAVWLCQLRLWLALAVSFTRDRDGEVPPLPNLDRSIRVGDTLTGGEFDTRLRVAPKGIAAMRARYARAHGARKRTLARELDRAERDVAVATLDERIAMLTSRRRSLVVAARSPDLFGARRPDRELSAPLAELRAELRAARRRRDAVHDGAALPFSFSTFFADAAHAGGFDVVIGNPPWVRPHNARTLDRAALAARFDVMKRRPWAPGDDAPRSAFAAQVDLAALFVEQSLRLCSPRGAVAMLVPAKLWRSLAGGALRSHLAAHARVVAAEDFTATHEFDAAVYPSLLVARKAPAPSAADVRVVLHRRDAAVTWTVASHALRFSDDPASPWILAPRRVTDTFVAIRDRGTELRATAFGVPRLGVKTGFNDAFVVRVLAADNGLARVEGVERVGCVERSVLRPVLRGSDVDRWRPRRDATAAIVWTHEGRDPCERLPPLTHEWLRQWRRELGARVDARGRARWWQLFRTPAAANVTHRVVWSDIGRSVRACVIEPGDPVVPLNTCYVLFAAERDAWALAALLNSPLTSAWLNVVAEPARGGYSRYLSWTMSVLPVPVGLDALACAGERARDGTAPDGDELTEIAARAYGLSRRRVAALLEWRDV